MLLGSVQICGEKISHRETQDLCNSLESHTIKLLSLRGCKIKDNDFDLLMKSFAKCKSILQLNLNLGFVNSLVRVRSLSEALTKNRSLTSLFLHGCPVGYSGIAVLAKGLALHPNVVSLDLGDCMLTDSAVLCIADLLAPNGAKRGLKDLTLSANPGITPHGWSKFFIAMAASNSLRNLHMDYNNIMDYGAGCLAVALAGTKTMHSIDLEGSGITELGAQTLLHLVRKYPVSVTSIGLADSNISDVTIRSIASAISENTSHQSNDMDETTETDEISSITRTETATDSESDVTVDQGEVNLGHINPSLRASAKEAATIKTTATTSTPRPELSAVQHSSSVPPRLIAQGTKPKVLSKSLTVPVSSPQPNGHSRSKSGPVEFQGRQNTTTMHTMKDVEKQKRNVPDDEESSDDDCDETSEEEEEDEGTTDVAKHSSVLSSPYYFDSVEPKELKRSGGSLLRKQTGGQNSTQEGLHMAYKEALNREQ